MSDCEANRLNDCRSVLAIRSRLLLLIRRYFHDHGFLEIDTPVRIQYPAPEPHIEAIESEGQYLRSSPELHMKRLMAAGYDRIFQIGPCFRNGEFGPRHHPEYTMLEWYRTHADYKDMMDDIRVLFMRMADEILSGNPFVRDGRHIDIKGNWKQIAVAHAYEQWAGWNPVTGYDPNRFDLDMSEVIEPRLEEITTPVVLTDFPVEAAALARRKGSQPDVVERWELYIGGVELANAYSELTDHDEQEARFRACNDDRISRGKSAYEPDPEFMAAMKAGMPPSGGVALGIDRLVMLLAGADALDEVLPFRK